MSEKKYLTSTGLVERLGRKFRGHEIELFILSKQREHINSKLGDDIYDDELYMAELKKLYGESKFIEYILEFCDTDVEHIKEYFRLNIDVLEAYRKVTDKEINISEYTEIKDKLDKVFK